MKANAFPQQLSEQRRSQSAPLSPSLFLFLSLSVSVSLYASLPLPASPAPAAVHRIRTLVSRCLSRYLSLPVSLSLPFSLSLPCLALCVSVNNSINVLMILWHATWRTRESPFALVQNLHLQPF